VSPREFGRLNPCMPQGSVTAAPLGFVPAWVDGESIYGWASRFHRLYGTSEKGTGLFLFGRSHACRLRDAPSGLDRFCLATAGVLGDAESLLRFRTPVGFFWPLLSTMNRDRVIQASMSTAGIRVPMALGLPAARMGSVHPLARCTECDLLSRRNDVVPTWMLSFQIPSAWLCPIHRRPLAQLRGLRNYWEYPDTASTVELPSPASPLEESALALLAEQGRLLLQTSHADILALRHATLHLLRGIGLCATYKRLSERRVQKFFDVSPIAQLFGRHPETKRLPRGAWIPDLLRGRAAGHPLKWLLLWNALTWEMRTDVAISTFADALNGVNSLCMGDQLPLWEADHISVSPTVPFFVKKAFDESETLHDAACALGITSGAARRWLEDYPDLLHEWKEKRFESRLQRARRNLNNALTANPELDRAGLLRLCRADDEWLRRHSPRTMRAILDRIPSSIGPQMALF